MQNGNQSRQSIHPYLFNARATYKPKQPEPPEWLRTIAVAGADFEGLMEAARVAIGLLLLSINSAKVRNFSTIHFLMFTA